MDSTTEQSVSPARGMAAYLLATAISVEYGIPMVLVRDTEKGHGLGGVIDGYAPKGTDFVSIVDDVFTTGSSLKQTINNLGNHNQTKVLGCHVVVKRGDGELSVPLTYLVDSNDLDDF